MPTLRQRAVVAALLVALFAASSLAGGGARDPARVLLGFAGDPATTCGVSWRTLEATPAAQAQIAREAGGPELLKSARTVPAVPSTVEVALGATVTAYSATFTGLRPATRYAYRVGDGKTWSPWYSFVTASTRPAPFRFLYFGDAQNGLADVWPRVVRAAQAQAPDARLVVHAGDLLAEGYDDELWRQWVEGLGPLAASVPQLAVPGNHDEHRPKDAPEPTKVHGVSALWRAHLRLPSNGPRDLPGLDGQNYYVDYQGVRFVALDVNAFANEDYVEAERARVQASVLAWLTETLAHNPNRWTIVVQHQTVYSVAKDRDYAAMRRQLAPLYDRYHVDLVLQGHDHAYARTRKLFGGRAVPMSARGTIYVLSVSGAKMYEVTNRHPAIMAKIVENRQLFQVISVDGGTLRCESRAANGEVVDRFELRKAATPRATARGAAALAHEHFLKRSRDGAYVLSSRR